MSTASADANKRRRDVARAAGICQTCCREPVVRGLSTCEACRQLKAKWNNGNAAAGMRGRPRWTPPPSPDRFNVCCSAHGFHRLGCSAA